MITYILILIISFLLDGYLPLQIDTSLNSLSIFSTMYSIIGITVITPYIDNNKKYFTILLVIGCLIDVAYMNTFLLNAVLFITIGIINKRLYNYFSKGTLIPIIISLISVILYNLFTYIILVTCNYMVGSVNIIIKVLTHNIISTILYTSILVFILSKLDKKYKLKIIK